eukprot:360282-Chlamydomonas_euryale.AAC.11
MSLHLQMKLRKGNRNAASEENICMEQSCAAHPPPRYGEFVTQQPYPMGTLFVRAAAPPVFTGASAVWAQLPAVAKVHTP